jgi:hypothetical protein
MTNHYKQDVENYRGRAIFYGRIGKLDKALADFDQGIESMHVLLVKY